MRSRCFGAPPGSTSGRLLVATEDNNVYALDATTGHLIWARSLGKPVPRYALRCGNIDPLGVTGTPVIDEATQSVYLDATVADASGPRHRIFAFYIPATEPTTRLRRTMKRGDCFLVFDSHGDIGASPGGPDGLFNCDTRYLSHFELLINGLQPLLLGSNLSDSAESA